MEHKKDNPTVLISDADVPAFECYEDWQNALDSAIADMMNGPTGGEQPVIDLDSLPPPADVFIFPEIEALRQTIYHRPTGDERAAFLSNFTVPDPMGPAYTKQFLPQIALLDAGLDPDLINFQSYGRSLNKRKLSEKRFSKKIKPPSAKALKQKAQRNARKTTRKSK